MATLYSYCYRSGEIEFGDHVPDGALPVLHGRPAHVRRTVSVRARLAHDGETLLVPGVPEAVDDDAAIAAYQRFRKFCWAKPASQTGGRP